MKVKITKKRIRTNLEPKDLLEGKAISHRKRAWLGKNKFRVEVAVNSIEKFDYYIEGTTRTDALGTLIDLDLYLPLWKVISPVLVILIFNLLGLFIIVGSDEHGTHFSAFTLEAFFIGFSIFIFLAFKNSHKKAHQILASEFEGDQIDLNDSEDHVVHRKKLANSD